MIKVIVTGGAGFIGRKVVEKLLEKQCLVTVIDNLSKESSYINKKAKFLQLDLRSKKGVTEVFKNADYCIHLAARIGGIGYFHKYPATILSDNNQMLTNVFDASVNANLKRIVYISSSMVYEGATSFPVQEADIEKIPQPKTAYGFSKLIGEKYCHSYQDQFGLPYTIIRPFNAYGPGELAEKEVGMAHVIPDLIYKVLKGQYPVEVLGDGRQVRCFTYVDDITEAVVRSLFEKKAENEDFNIANPKPIKVNNLLKVIWKTAGMKKKLSISHVDPFSMDVKIRIPDTTKAKKLLKFTPKMELEDGIKEVIDWQKNFYEKNKS